MCLRFTVGLQRKRSVQNAVQFERTVHSLTRSQISRFLQLIALKCFALLIQCPCHVCESLIIRHDASEKLGAIKLVSKPMRRPQPASVDAS